MDEDDDGDDASSSRPRRASVVFHDPGVILEQFRVRRDGRLPSKESVGTPTPRHQHQQQPVSGSHVPRSNSFRSQAYSCPPVLMSARSQSASSNEGRVKETIRVVIRIRPLMKKEAAKQQNDLEFVRVDASGLQISVGGSMRSPRQSRTSVVKLPRPEKSYAFDRVFDSRASCPQPATQEQLYQEVGERLVEGALAGYNGCLLAYGQTGAGKTHTVVGRAEDPGLLPRVVEGLFAEAMARSKSEGTVWSFKASLMELYNEMLRDLLVPMRDRNNNGLSIRYNPNLGLVINDLKEVVITTLEEARELLDFGMKMRSIAATSMNSHSSRAHTIFTFRLEQTNEGGNATMAQVQIVDLAGREHEQEKVSGDPRMRVKERSFINRSLFHLSLCIGNLSKGSNAGGGTEHAFRNSKLTMVLMNSLGKNSRTALLAAISPAERDLEETMSTLRFASTVKLIQTQAMKNTLNKFDLVDGLQEEIQRLRSEQSVELEERVAELEALCQQYRSDLEEEREQSRNMARQRRKTLTRLGLSLTEQNELLADEPEEDTPYLVNLSEDPFLEGCLMYLLKRGTPTTVGSAPSSSIHLVGLGVGEQHCTITCKDDDELILETAEEPVSCDGGRVHALTRPRTLVNGRRITGAGTEVSLSHQDRLILGHSFVFRVVVPSTARNLAREPEPCLQDSYLQALEEIEDYNGRPLSRFLQRFSNEQLNVRDGEGKTLMQEIHLLAAQIEEANSITAMVQPEGIKEFQLLLGDPFFVNKPGKDSELLVAVISGNCEDDSEASASPFRGSLRSPPDSAAPSPRIQSARLSRIRQSIRYTWSVSKFRSRLQKMRDLYEDLAQSGVKRVRRRLQMEPFCNPWHEIGEADVELLLQGISAACGVGAGVRPYEVVKAWDSEEALHLEHDEEDESTSGASDAGGVEDDVGIGETYPWYDFGMKYIQSSSMRRSSLHQDRLHRLRGTADLKEHSSKLGNDVDCQLWLLDTSHPAAKWDREHWNLHEVQISRAGALSCRSSTAGVQPLFNAVPLAHLHITELPEGATWLKFAFAVSVHRVGQPSSHADSQLTKEPVLFGADDEDAVMRVLREYAYHYNASNQRMQMLVARSADGTSRLPPRISETSEWMEHEAWLRRSSDHLAAKQALLQELQQDLLKLGANTASQTTVLATA